MRSSRLFKALVRLSLVLTSMASVDDTDVDTEWGRAIRQEDAPVRPDPAVACASRVVEDVDIAIVGGGLVGLAVAIGLTRSGINVKVFERAPKLRSVSQGILSVQPNGMAALDKIHPDIPRLAKEVGCERWQLVETTIHANGTTTEKVTNTGKETLDKFGRLKVALTWHNMQKVLASLLPPNVVVTNRALSSFVEIDDAVFLYFDGDDDVPIVRAKAVLGCDGVFSVVRRQMFPEDRPIYFGQLNWASIIDTDKLPPNIHPPNAVHYFSHHGEPRWMSMFSDGGGGKTFWQFRVADPAKALSLSGSKGRGGLGLKGVKESILPVALPSQDVHAGIGCIPEAQIFERSIVGRMPLPTWRSNGGRVALVGDSAHGMHPNIAQGANNAFVSAAAIVKAMVAHKEQDEDWISAFEEYERGRKPRADIVQTFANMMGITQSTGKQFFPQQVVRDALDWIVRGGDDSLDKAPRAIVELARTFDPTAEPGVSLL